MRRAEGTTISGAASNRCDAARAAINQQLASGRTDNPPGIDILKYFLAIIAEISIWLDFLDAPRSAMRARQWF